MCLVPTPPLTQLLPSWMLGQTWAEPSWNHTLLESHFSLGTQHGKSSDSNSKTSEHLQKIHRVENKRLQWHRSLSHRLKHYSEALRGRASSGKATGRRVSVDKPAKSRQPAPVYYLQLSSVTQLCVTLCWSHGLQHARLPCPSPTPWAYSNSCPSSQWCHPTISSSVVPFSSCLQSFPASGSFPWVNSSHQVAKVLEFQPQHQSFQWIFRTDFLLDGLVGSPCSPRNSQESSPTPQFKSINSSALFSYSLSFSSSLWGQRVAAESQVLGIRKSKTCRKFEPDTLVRFLPYLTFLYLASDLSKLSLHPCLPLPPPLTHQAVGVQGKDDWSSQSEGDRVPHRDTPGPGSSWGRDAFPEPVMVARKNSWQSYKKTTESQTSFTDLGHLLS